MYDVLFSLPGRISAAIDVSLRMIDNKLITNTDCYAAFETCTEQ